MFHAFRQNAKGEIQKNKEGPLGIIISSERGTCDIPLEQA